jgi:hypothetical protein
MGLFDFASNVAETFETNTNNQLKTHYYKDRYNNIKQIVLNYALINKITVRSEDDVHGEIYLQAGNYHMIVSILQVSPLETAVDVKVQTYRILGLFKPVKLILNLFKHIDSKANFKGVGLHP